MKVVIILEDLEAGVCTFKLQKFAKPGEKPNDGSLADYYGTTIMSVLDEIAELQKGEPGACRLH